MGSYFLHAIFDKVPNHEKVEAHEQPQHSPTVRHQGAQGVGQLLRLCDDTKTVEDYLNLGHILYIHIERITNKLKCMCICRMYSYLDYCLNEYI